MKKDKPTHKESLDEMRALLQRTQADFINYRRRNEEDRADFMMNAHADIITQILPVMDNFSLAAKHVPDELINNNWVVGVQAIEKQMEQILEANGLEKIRTIGEEYNHHLHEAVAETKDKSKKNNIILTEELAGYTINGKLLRPAKVTVNNLNVRKAPEGDEKGE